MTSPVPIPADAAMPSGHAAAAVVGLLHPRLRPLMVAVVAAVGLSRVHLGAGVAWPVVAAARAVRARRQHGAVLEVGPRA